MAGTKKEAVKTVDSKAEVTKAADIKTEVTKAADGKAEVTEAVDVKTIAVAAPAEMAASEPKTTAKKAAAKTSEAKITKKTEVSKPAESKGAEKTPEPKAAAKKAAEPKVSVIVEYAGKHIATSDILATAKKSFTKANKGVAIKTMDVYVKPEENVAYYVVNGIGSDDYKVEL